MTEGSVGSPSSKRDFPMRDGLTLTLVGGVTFILAFTLAMTKGLNHDEHQHLAAGAMWARYGLLPYRDFPLFHMPYLPAIYAVLFTCTDYLLLSARLFSVLCVTATVTLVAGATIRLFSRRSLMLQCAAALGAAALFVTAPQFTQTTGRAWNFEAGTLCALGAFLCYGTALHREKPWLLFMAGALASFAVGIRVTFAPLTVALLLLFVVAPPRGSRKRAFAFCLAGLAAAAVPALLLTAIAPEQFFSGNFGYADMAYSYHTSGESARTMTVPTKLRYFFKEIIRRNWPVMVAFTFALVSAVAHLRANRQRWPDNLRIVATVFPFLLVGSLGPSPLRAQYFFPLLPLLTLGAVAAIAALPSDARLARTILVVGGASALVAVPLSARQYRHFPELANPRAWTPIEIHAVGAAIAELTPAKGRVLTLSPTTALEGGRKIYPAFVTGPFAWRVGKFLDFARRKRLRIVAPEDLPELVRNEPPAACVTGAEERFEAAIVEYAQKAHFAPHTLSDQLTLWRAP